MAWNNQQILICKKKPNQPTNQDPYAVIFTLLYATYWPYYCSICDQFKKEYSFTPQRHDQRSVLNHPPLRPNFFSLHQQTQTYVSLHSEHRTSLSFSSSLQCNLNNQTKRRFCQKDSFTQWIAWFYNIKNTHLLAVNPFMLGCHFFITAPWTVSDTTLSSSGQFSLLSLSLYRCRPQN